MRPLTTVATVASAVALVAVSACGSETEPDVEASSRVTASAAPSAPAPVATEPPAERASAASVRSTADDVAAYAVAMEQVFFGSGYPDDLAGALVTAEKLTNLSLSPGNVIASYRFDPETREFQLCVENPSGASATYDTEPMSTVATTDSGGCP